VSTRRDGTPRVGPIGFHWNGEKVVLATATGTPKIGVPRHGSRVAVSIDSDALSSRVLPILLPPRQCRATTAMQLSS